MKIKHIIPLVLLATAPLLSWGQTAPKENNSLRLMTYNVFNGMGMDNQVDYRRTADVISGAMPDVVAIQEVDSSTVRSNGKFVLAEIASHALMHYTYAPAIDFQGGSYGVGILSKERPSTSRIIPLPGREEKRVLLIAEFADYVFCSTHLSLNEEDRRVSAGIIFDAVLGYDKPVFLAGDMNDVPGSELNKLLLSKFTMLNSTKRNTYPSDDPKSCIDHIYGYFPRGNYAILRTNAIAEGMASDHRPVYADIRMEADAASIMRTLPYLQNPTNGGITVCWQTNVPVHGWVEFGTDIQLGSKTQSIVDGQVICNNRNHKIRLDSLIPGQTYYYRVCSREMLYYGAYSKTFGETAYSQVYSFRMPDPGDTDFTALIFNDLHKKRDVMDALMKQVGDRKYDFVIFNGDFVDDPYNEDQALDYLSYINEKCHAESVPVFYLRGNHEIRNAYSIEMRELFDYVGDKTYGAFNWGDTRFVMLDCGEDKPDSHYVYYGLNDFEQLRNDQVGFLERETADKEFRKAKRRVLIHHIPIYGSDDGYNPCYDLWHPVLSKSPFDININGHTHRFAYHPKDTQNGNNFPVIIGGGNRIETATVTILNKAGDKMSITALSAGGDVLLQQEL